jgi:hypothetical protein
MPSCGAAAVLLWGRAASGHGLPDAAPAVRDPVLQHWPSTGECLNTLEGHR